MSVVSPSAIKLHVRANAVKFVCSAVFLRKDLAFGAHARAAPKILPQIVLSPIFYVLNGVVPSDVVLALTAGRKRLRRGVRHLVLDETNAAAIGLLYHRGVV